MKNISVLPSATTCHDSICSPIKCSPSTHSAALETQTSQEIARVISYRWIVVSRKFLKPYLNLMVLSSVYRTAILSSVVATFSSGFAPSSVGFKWITNVGRVLYSSNDANFDAKGFEEALRSISPTNGKSSDATRNAVIADIRQEQISRKYPFDDYTEQLPILPDCNNYYSGKYGDYSWHQNADQVFVYLPVDDSITKRDVEVKFEALSVQLFINDELITEFATIERLIPDGSFWVFEQDKNGQKYIQLDLEKRYRMINWKNLFIEAPKTTESEAENRRKMLESLFAANKGMSKMTGKEPESMDEMMKNEALMKMIREVNSKPEFSEDADYEGDEEEVILDAEVVGNGYNNEGFMEYDEAGNPSVVLDAPFDVKGFVKKSADKYFPEESESEEDS